MANEASKTNRVRGIEFAQKYFSGRVIDIGCGNDLVVPEAEPFDWKHGDAQDILKYRNRETYDCVHSSHCLEHMKDVRAALAQWWELVKPGGYLVLVVPDEDLYEQGVFPSLFNPDHKATFRFNKPSSNLPNSYEIQTLVGSLAGAEIISAEIQDEGYDYTRKRWGVSGVGKWFLWVNKIRLVVFGVWNIRSRFLHDLFSEFLFHCGVPIDQTSGAAMAQIQVAARKRKAGQ